jgi:hypothetical protein
MRKKNGKGRGRERGRGDREVFGRVPREESEWSRGLVDRDLSPVYEVGFGVKGEGK